MAVRRFRLAGWLVAAVCLLGGFAPSAAAAPKSVLILAEDPVVTYGALLRANIVAALRRDGAEPLNIYEELIDRNRFDNEEYDRQLVTLYKAKYTSPAPDLIVTITEPALDFVLRHRYELFPASALLFGAVDERVLRGRVLGPNDTGVLQHYDARATVEAALAAHPRTRQILVVGGGSRFDQAYVDAAREDLGGLASVVVTFLADKPLSDVLAAVAALPDDGLVLFLSMQSDGNGVRRTGPEVLAALRRVARAPIYGMSGNFLGSGIVGGMLSDNDIHGADLVQRARQILSGVRAADLPLMTSRNTLAFDWHELKRFGIDEGRLPAGATVANREPGLWETHKRTILLTSAALIGQLLLIAALIAQRSRRRQTDARHDAILRALPDLMFLQSADGTYLDYHAADTRDLAVSPEQFVGRNMREVLPPALLRQVEPAFARAVVATDPVVVEYELDAPHGTLRFEARLVRTNDQILTLVRDVTERRKAEDALREGAQRYSLASVAGSVGVWDWNFEKDELYVDPQLKSLLGFEDEEITNHPTDWGSRVYPGDLPAAAAAVKACIEGESDVYEIEHRMVHKDGSVKWFLSRGLAMRGVDGTLHRLVGTKVDITQRKRAEQVIRESEAALRASNREIRDLAGALLTAQDAERARIARDLHDDVSQQVAALSIALSGLTRRVRAESPPQDLLAGLASIEQRAVGVADSIRAVSHDLHPDVFKHGGLAASLTVHCADISRAHAIVVSCTIEDGIAAVEMGTALCLYRVAKEALHNVVKHAGASRAEIRLFRIGDSVELTVSDDGRGFDIAEAQNSGKGLGLLSIYERVRLAGGSASVVTEWDKGTRVHVRLPSGRRAKLDERLAPGRHATI